MMRKLSLEFILLCCLFVLAFLIRFVLVNKWVTGDVLVHKEWGQKIWEYGTRNFYSSSNWDYSSPTQPPITSLMFGGAFWLFDHKYILAQVHNSTHLVPASVINYFYDMPEPVNKKGYIFLLKLPAILADLGLGILIYRIIIKITKSRKKAVFGSLLYLFNPVTVFLSGGWGQTESLLALFGILSFVCLERSKFYLSIPLFFVCLYIKPTWVIFTPLLFFLLFLYKPKIKSIFVGIFLTLLIFLVTTIPFSGGDFLGYVDRAILKDIIGKEGTARASVSAFNFYTIIFKMDRDLAGTPIIGIPANLLGIFSFVVINIFTFIWLKRQKKDLISILIAVFTIGLGSFLFLTSMLERYFFASFAPMIVVAFVRPRVLFYAIILNLIVFSNLIYAFFRRGSDELDAIFTGNNFLLVRIISGISLWAWWSMIRSLGLFKNIKVRSLILS